MSVIHKCKDNDAVLKFIIDDGEIDEIWLQDPTSRKSWFVIGYNDLLEGINKANEKIKQNGST